MKHQNTLKNQAGAALVLELILVAVVLAAVGFAAYQFYQSKQAKTDTNKQAQTTPAAKLTFKDSEGKVSLEYPKSWTAKSKSLVTASNAVNIGTITPTEALNAFKSEYGNEDMSGGGAVILKAQSTQSPKDWYKSAIGAPAGQFEEKNLQINGYAAYYLKDMNKSYTDRIYVVANKGLIIMVSFREIDRSFEADGKLKDENVYTKYVAEFETIVNSIKFSN